MRATIHNARAGKDGAFSPRHNDRNFDISHAEHIDPERIKNNRYWNWMNDPQMNFEAAEKIFYEKYISAHLEAQNARYKAQRHVERVKSIDDYRASPQTCPEEVIWMIGKSEDTIPAEMAARIIQEQINWEQKRFPGLRVLNVALHMDEQGAPHIHERRAWVYVDKTGNLAIGQNKALEQMGIKLPYPDKPRSRYNNRKQEFSRICREHFLQVCRKHGLEIEEKPQEQSKAGRKLEDYKASQTSEVTNNLIMLNKKLNMNINIKQSQIDDLEEEYFKTKENLKDLQNMLHTVEQRKMFELFYQHERERTR